MLKFNFAARRMRAWQVIAVAGAALLAPMSAKAECSDILKFGIHDTTVLNSEELSSSSFVDIFNRNRSEYEKSANSKDTGVSIDIKDYGGGIFEQNRTANYYKEVLDDVFAFKSGDQSKSSRLQFYLREINEEVVRAWENCSAKEDGIIVKTVMEDPSLFRIDVVYKAPIGTPSKVKMRLDQFNPSDIICRHGESTAKTVELTDNIPVSLFCEKAEGVRRHMTIKLSSSQSEFAGVDEIRIPANRPTPSCGAWDTDGFCIEEFVKSSGNLFSHDHRSMVGGLHRMFRPGAKATIQTKLVLKQVGGVIDHSSICIFGGNSASADSSVTIEKFGPFQCSHGNACEYTIPIGLVPDSGNIRWGLGASQCNPKFKSSGHVVLFAR